MDLTALFGHPLVQTALYPLILAAVLTGLIRLIGGPGRGALLAGAAIGATLLATHLLVFGLPETPPRSATEKLFLLSAIALAAGFLLDLIRDRQIAVLSALIVIAAAGLWWLGESRLGTPKADAAWLRYGLVLAAGLLCLVRLEGRSGDGLNPSVMVLAAAVGAGAVAVIGSSAALGQSLFALAAATGGFMLWNWPVSRFPFNRAALLGAGLALLFLIGQAVFFTRAPAAAFVPLIAVFYADAVAGRMIRRGGRVAAAMGPVMLGVVAILPVLAAIGIAQWLSGGGDDLYR